MSFCEDENLFNDIFDSLTFHSHFEPMGEAAIVNSNAWLDEPCPVTLNRDAAPETTRIYHSNTKLDATATGQQMNAIESALLIQNYHANALDDPGPGHLDLTIPVGNHADMGTLNVVQYAQYEHSHLASEQVIAAEEGTGDDGLIRDPGNQVTSLDGTQIELRTEALCVQFPIVNLEEWHYQTNVDHSTLQPSSLSRQHRSIQPKDDAVVIQSCLKDTLTSPKRYILHFERYSHEGHEMIAARNGRNRTTNMVERESCVVPNVVIEIALLVPLIALRLNC